MKSPPADIFVWGVHKETSKEDIKNDLAASDIKVEIKDIIKKSHDDAHVCSYKISVAAEDLEKALCPEIWPLRVKVREFVHFTKKNNNNNRDQHNQVRQQPQNQEGVTEQQQRQHPQQREEHVRNDSQGEPRVEEFNLPLFNRYDMLQEEEDSTLL